MPGTEYAQQPFWSPDGRYVGFFAGGRLRHVEISTGHIESVATVSDPRGATWAEGGDILFSDSCCAALTRVAPGGGAVAGLTELDPALGETSHRYPWALPGGKAVLFTMPDGKQPGIYWLSLATKKRLLLAPQVSRAIYDPHGFLLWGRDGSVVARRFDATSGAFSGDTLVVAERVGTDPEKTGQDLFAAGGQMVAVRDVAPVQRELRWFDRKGTPGEVVASLGNYYEPALSPDDARVAVAQSPVPSYFKSDIWVYNTATRERGARLSFAGGTTPLWSADGRTLYYAVDADGEHRIVAKDADGSGGEQVVYKKHSAIYADDDSRGEPLLALEGTSGAGTYKLWLLPLAGKPEARPFQQTAAGSQAHSAFSPDGRLIAYTSDESGLPQIYVQPVDGSAGRWQVTNEGGDLAVWRADGKELFYVGADRILRAVPLRSLSPFEAGEPEELFATTIPQLAITSQHSYYLPSNDGKRFLVNTTVSTGGDPGILAIMDWSALASGGKTP